MADSLEEFNKHQQDLTNRVTTFVQMLFVLSGGALSISIAVFTGPRSVSLSDHVAQVLSVSWWSLVASVALLCSMLAAIILRDYFFGERWRKYLDDPSVDPKGKQGWIEVLIIVLGLLGVLGFIIGFVGLAFVATALLKVA